MEQLLEAHAVLQQADLEAEQHQHQSGAGTNGASLSSEMEQHHDAQNSIYTETHNLQHLAPSDAETSASGEGEVVEKKRVRNRKRKRGKENNKSLESNEKEGDVNVGGGLAPKRPPFSELKGAARRNAIVELKKMLKKLSGGDSHSLLQAILDSRFGKQLSGATSIETTAAVASSSSSSSTPIDPETLSRSMRTSHKWREIALNILHQHRLAPSHLKRRWASLVARSLTHKEMRELGFEISNNGFAKARKHAKVHGPGAEIVKPLNDDEDEDEDDGMLDGRGRGRGGRGRRKEGGLSNGVRTIGNVDDEEDQEEDDDEDLEGEGEEEEEEEEEEDEEETMRRHKEYQEQLRLHQQQQEQQHQQQQQQQHLHLHHLYHSALQNSNGLNDLNDGVSS